MDVTEKSIAVLGLGRSGASVARLLSSQGAHVSVFDSGESAGLQRHAAELRREGINVLIGANARCTQDYSLAVVSPGIDLASPFANQFSERQIPLSGELEVAWSYCEKPVIAITGTNGKTTTTELITAMLNHAGQRTVACGNIGLPFSEVVAGNQDVYDCFTLEVSSFQLETIETFRPRVALWLNLTPDHLDRYPSISEYRAAKLRIFENQTSADWAICNSADDLPDLHGKRITFNAYGGDADFQVQGQSITCAGRAIAKLESFRLQGLHNAENIMAALATGKALGLTFADALPPLQSYQPSPHRCELAATVDGVQYINDSKATNVDALAKALTLGHARVILIAGGKDKGFNFSEIRPLVGRKVSTAILIGEMAGRIRADWDGAVPCRMAATLQEAVELASELAHPGDTVLFSPGTSSFDMFRDYADRGEQFRLAAKNLSNTTAIPS